MSSWDGQIRLNRSLAGPNLFGPCSGALVVLTLSPELAVWLKRPPQAAERMLWQGICEVTLGRVASVAAFPERQADTSWAHHLLALNDALRLPYCIEQHPARVYAFTDRQIVVFVPCDDTQLGLRVTAISAAMLFDRLETTSDGLQLRLATLRSDQWIQHWLGYVRVWRNWAEAHALNSNARWIAQQAVLQGVPCYRPPGSKSLLRLGHGVYQRRLDGAVTDAVNSVASNLSKDKWQTSVLFASHGLPTTQACVVSSVEKALAVAHRLGWPVVVKPRSTNKGIGITVNVQDEQTLRKAFELAASFRTGVLLEQHVPGSDHRLLVVGGRFVAAARRMPAQIVGDGCRTVSELIQDLNLARIQERAPGVYFPHVSIDLGEQTLGALKAAGYRPDDVLPSGVALSLRGPANLSTGGFSEDVTPRVHPDNRELAERAARLIDLSMAGVDLQTTDISRSWREVGGAILEINAGPGLVVHLPPTPHHNVPKAILEDLFPQGANWRVPTAGVTGSLGKTTTCRMLAKILEHSGHTVALTGTQGAFIGGKQLREGDLAGGRAALSMLQDRSVTASVAELARGGLIKSGLGLDALDVGAVLNVNDNHLGLDGIHTREQLARVKQLVVRHAKRLAVLNADDPLCLAMCEGMEPSRVCLVSEAIGPIQQAHLQLGGVVATIRQDSRGPLLSLRQGGIVIGEMLMESIPATWGARFRPAMLNALFAAALAYGLGVPFQCIKQALSGFASDFLSNPGRMNRVSGLPFDLWLASCDGPQALLELRRFIDLMADKNHKRLVFFMAGNRPNDFIEASAQAVAGAFDRYYCTEMEEDLRGRAPGEVAALLAQTLQRAGVEVSSILVEPSTKMAVRNALSETPAGGLLVVESAYPEKVMTAVRAIWPQAV